MFQLEFHLCSVYGKQVSNQATFSGETNRGMRQMDSQVEEQRGTGGRIVWVVQGHLVRLLPGPDSLTFTGPLPPGPLGLFLASRSDEGLGV